MLTAVNVSETLYEKIRFEALEQCKSVQDIIKERIFYKPFSDDVEAAYDALVNEKYEAFINE